MGRTLLVILLLVVVAGLLIMIGQVAGFYDVPVLRGIQGLVPMAQAPLEPAALTPQATPTRPISTPPSFSSPVPTKTDECSASSLRFVHGTAALKAALGTSMGEPTECERVIDTAGNTEQKTTTGLAYYRARINVAAFTNGFDHWALTPDGLVHWTGEDVDPPPDAEPAG